MPASSISPSSKPSYQLYCGIDIAAKTFTASLCLPDEDPTKALNFKQTPEDFNQLRKYLLSSGLAPDQILVVMEATGRDGYQGHPPWLAAIFSHIRRLFDKNGEDLPELEKY